MGKVKLKKLLKIIVSLLLIPVILLLLIFMWLTIYELFFEQHKLGDTNLTLLYVDDCDGIFLMESHGGSYYYPVVDDKDFRKVYWNGDKIVGITYGETGEKGFIRNGKRSNYYLITKKGDLDYVVEKFDPTIDFDSLLITTFGDTLACHKYHWKRFY